MKFLFCILFLAIFSLAFSRLSRSVEKRLEREIRKAERLFLEKTEGMSKSRLRSLITCSKTLQTILGLLKESFVTFCQKGANHLLNWVRNNICPKLPCSNCCDKFVNWINSKMRRRRRILAEKSVELQVGGIVNQPDPLPQLSIPQPEPERQPKRHEANLAYPDLKPQPDPKPQHDDLPQPHPFPQPKPKLPKANFCPAIWKDLLSWAESQLC